VSYGSHPNIADIYSEIGEVYGQLDQMYKSLEFTLKCVEEYKKLYGDNMHNYIGVSIDYNNL